MISAVIIAIIAIVVVVSVGVIVVISTVIIVSSVIAIAVSWPLASTVVVVVSLTVIAGIFEMTAVVVTLPIAFLFHDSTVSFLVASASTFGAIPVWVCYLVACFDQPLFC